MLFYGDEKPCACIRLIRCLFLIDRFFFYQNLPTAQWALVLVSINQLLSTLNSAFNFLIYLSFCGRRRNRRQRHSSGYVNTTQSFLSRGLGYASSTNRHTGEYNHKPILLCYVRISASNIEYFGVLTKLYRYQLLYEALFVSN